jgi:hypothetical protein
MKVSNEAVEAAKAIANSQERRFNQQIRFSSESAYGKLEQRIQKACDEFHESGESPVISQVTSVSRFEEEKPVETMKAITDMGDWLVEHSWEEDGISVIAASEALSMLTIIKKKFKAGE